MDYIEDDHRVDPEDWDQPAINGKIDELREELSDLNSAFEAFARRFDDGEHEATARAALLIALDARAFLRLIAFFSFCSAATLAVFVWHSW